MDATATLDIDALAEQIAATAAGIDAATHRFLADLREFDERGGWSVQGAQSCAAWLSWKCGLAPGAAREKVRVAGALARLPLIDDELRRGQLSFSKVRALTRVATPANEASLVELARASTAAQLEKMCRLIDQLRPMDPVATEEKRWLRARDLPNGMVRIEAQLLPEEAARVLAACDVLAAKASERADALLTMAEATLRGDKPDRPPVEVMVHVDAATLSGDSGTAGVSAESCRRLLCDAGVVPVLEQNGEPLSVGRKLRVFAGALRRALLARDHKCCRFPGCTNTRYLHAHHIAHWIDGGETRLSNALTLCTRHHRLVHEGGFRVRADASGGVTFLRPDGRTLDDVPASPLPHPLPAVVLPPTWDGDPFDHEAAVWHAM